jgi:DNA-binding NarL/FixJ family response regulator
MPYVRTRVVDDADDFRHFLCSSLQEGTRCEVVGEASDGLRAVQQSEELLPDLILLDLGLPTLNGMEGARRIRNVSPNSKILFVTQNFFPEIAEGALRMGACGYLLKSDATDLPRAVETVLHCAKYVSSRVTQFAPPNQTVRSSASD